MPHRQAQCITLWQKRFFAEDLNIVLETETYHDPVTAINLSPMIKGISNKRIGNIFKTNNLSWKELHKVI